MACNALLEIGMCNRLCSVTKVQKMITKPQNIKKIPPMRWKRFYRFFITACYTPHIALHKTLFKHFWHVLGFASTLSIIAADGCTDGTSILIFYGLCPKKGACPYGVYAILCQHVCDVRSEQTVWLILLKFISKFPKVLLFGWWSTEWGYL